MPTSRSEVMKKLRELGGTFDDFSNDRWELKGSVESPPGHVWVSTDCHSISVDYHSDRPAGWEFILSEISQGVIECTDEDCEVCEESR